MAEAVCYFFPNGLAHVGRALWPFTGEGAVRTLIEAAHELGLTYQAAHRLVLPRKLDGEKRGKHW